MKRLIFALGILIAGHAAADTRTIPPVGQSKAAADAAHVNVTGDTMTGVLLFPVGTSTDPSMAFASESGTGWHLSKALRQAWTIDGTGIIMTLDTTTGLVVDVNVTLGNAIGDAVTFHGGTWNILNLLTANFSGDYVLEVGANTMTINAVTGALEVNAPSVFDGTFEVKGTNGIEFSPGPGVDATFLAPQIVGSPTLGWVDVSKSWKFVSPLIVNNPITVSEVVAPATPSAGEFVVYATSANKIFGKNDAGTEFDLTAGDGITIKSGAEAAGSFTGNPRVATITFATAFADANYSVSVINTDARTWTIDSQVAASFVINTNASQALTAAVSWIAIAHNDP